MKHTQSLPERTTGHDFLHSWRHFYIDLSEPPAFASRAACANLGFTLFPSTATVSPASAFPDIALAMARGRGPKRNAPCRY